MSDWIKVEDRLPEDGKNVLGFGQHEQMIVFYTIGGTLEFDP